MSEPEIHRFDDFRSDALNMVKAKLEQDKVTDVSCLFHWVDLTTIYSSQNTSHLAI